MSYKQPAVYMLASQKKGTLYVGVTLDLVQRVWVHKNKLNEGFSKKYGAQNLVYFEFHGDMPTAIKREKQIKKWRRHWKMELIEKNNANWRDLYPEII